MATQDDYIKTALRLPRELHSRLLESAEGKGRSLNAELIDRLQSAGESPAALIEALARLNLTLAERELELQHAEAYIDRLTATLRFAYRSIKNSPIEPTSLDCLDDIEELIELRGTATDDLVWRRRREEKFKKLRQAQAGVAEVRAGNLPPSKGSSESEDPLRADKPSKKSP
jgi:hypothetical protein